MPSNSTPPDHQENMEHDGRGKYVSNEKEPETEEQPHPPATFWQIVMSTLAAAFGVQKQKNLERDFAQQSFLPYIVAGIIFTLLFIASIIGMIMLAVKWQGLA